MLQAPTAFRPDEALRAMGSSNGVPSFGFPTKCSIVEDYKRVVWNNVQWSIVEVFCNVLEPAMRLAMSWNCFRSAEDCYTG